MQSVHLRPCVGDPLRFNCTSVNHALASCVAMRKLIPSNLQIAQLAVLPYWISKHTTCDGDNRGQGATLQARPLTSPLATQAA